MALKRVTLDNGEVLDQETYNYLVLMSGMFGKDLTKHVSQGSYSSRVKVSGSTHKGSGAFDLTRLSERELDKCVAIWRMITAGRGTAWKRLPNKSWGLHGHFILLTAESDPSIELQFKAYLRGGDGLGGTSDSDNGPRDWVNAVAADPGTIDYSIVGAKPGLPSTGVDDLQSIGKSALTLQSLYTNLTDPEMLKRILLFLVGLILLITALIRITAASLPVDIDVAGLAKTMKGK